MRELRRCRTRAPTNVDSRDQDSFSRFADFGSKTPSLPNVCSRSFRSRWTFTVNKISLLRTRWPQISNTLILLFLFFIVVALFAIGIYSSFVRCLLKSVWLMQSYKRNYSLWWGDYTLVRFYWWSYSRTFGPVNVSCSFEITWVVISNSL